MFIGMVVMQQNVDGFDRYFLELTPAQRLVYGRLGLFNIYHVWYFNVLLGVLSLNIILASIDRFPKTWTFVSKPNHTVPLRWLREQKQTADLTMDGTTEAVADKIKSSMKKAGWRKIVTTEKGGRTYIFGQSGTWNRFGAYAVHVGLLTIFAGGFLTSQFGATGQMPVAQGKPTNLMLDTVVDLDKTVRSPNNYHFRSNADMQQKADQERRFAVGNEHDRLDDEIYDHGRNRHYRCLRADEPSF